MNLRAAIAGAGLMGRWHAQTVAQLGGTIAGVFDRDPAAAQRLADQFSGARAGTSLAEVLAGNRADVLHLCTPLASHGELAAQALAQGLHVLAEKPLTPTAPETARLYALAAEHRVLLCPVHQFPFQRGIAHATQALGRIGRLRHFEARFCSAGGVGKSNEAIEEIVADILPHPLSLMHLISPGSLQSSGWAVSRPAAGELRATLTFADVCFSILISMHSRPTSTALLLFGTAGTIHVDLFHGFGVVEPGDVSRWRKIVHPFDLATRTLVAAGANLALRAWTRESAYPGLRALTAAFYAAIRDGSSSPIGAEEAVAIARVREVLSETARPT